MGRRVKLSLHLMTLRALERRHHVKSLIYIGNRLIGTACEIPRAALGQGSILSKTIPLIIMVRINVTA